MVTHIKQVLEEKGYKILWHHSHFIGGKPITDNINDAVNESRKVIFVFTRNFISSEYCMMELNSTLDRLQRTRTRCMIPIALEDESTVPAELKSTVTYWPILHEEDMNTDKLFELLGKDFDVLSFQSFSLFLGSSIRNTVQEK